MIFQYEYEKKSQEHRHVHDYKIEVANREFKAQKGTIRDRLMNSIGSRKIRLGKDKEITDIADHPAALLHPNQYSITNPASPGGMHHKRATRLRQPADDISGIGEGRKRKRNAADEDGSPAPQRRMGDMNGTTALWQGDRLAARKTTGPVYSIDKLFTDKELAMQHNVASLAAHKYLLSHHGRVNGAGQGAASSSGSESGDHEDGEQDGTDSAPSAAMMERVPSHATRSTRAGAQIQNQNFVDDKFVGIEALANFEMPQNLEKIVAAEPKLPPIFLTTYAKPQSAKEVNSPSVLPPEEVHSDMMVMKMLRQYESIHGVGSNFDTQNGGRKVLEAAAYSTRDDRYVAFLQHERRDPDDLRKDLRLPISSIRDDPVTPSSGVAGVANAVVAPPMIGASPMSRQSSQGGAAMSRQGSSTRAQRKRM
jgi:hypothetical protein